MVLLTTVFNSTHSLNLCFCPQTSALGSDDLHAQGKIAFNQCHYKLEADTVTQPLVLHLELNQQKEVFLYVPR